MVALESRRGRLYLLSSAWLEKRFSQLLDDNTFRRDVLLVITFDENSRNWPYLTERPNKVYTVLYGDAVATGTYADIYSHYDLLRTIEENFGTKPMADGDGNARPIAGVWR